MSRDCISIIACWLLLLLQEQYKFCFEMVLAFLAEFETYANFTWKGDESPVESDE